MHECSPLCWFGPRLACLSVKSVGRKTQLKTTIRVIQIPHEMRGRMSSLAAQESARGLVCESTHSGCLVRWSRISYSWSRTLSVWGALDLGFGCVDYGDIVEELWSDTAPHPRRSRSTRTRHRETSSLRHRSQPRPRQNVDERQTFRQRRVQSSPRGDASRSSHRSDGSGRTPGELSSSFTSGSGELLRDPSQPGRRRFRL